MQVGHFFGVNALRLTFGTGDDVVSVAPHSEVLSAAFTSETGADSDSATNVFPVGIVEGRAVLNAIAGVGHRTVTSYSAGMVSRALSNAEQARTRDVATSMRAVACDLSS